MFLLSTMDGLGYDEAVVEVYGYVYTNWKEQDEKKAFGQQL